MTVTDRLTADAPHRLRHNALEREVLELVDFLSEPRRNDPDQYEVIKTRIDCVNFVTQAFEREHEVAEVRRMRRWFRQVTDPVLSSSNTCRRARVWPEGYPGDFRTLEGIYANTPVGDGLAQHLDRYSLSSTLAVAIRSRLRRMTELLTSRQQEEGGSCHWLNLACGPCRELLSLAAPDAGQTIVHCVDTDPNALHYARILLAQSPVATDFIPDNALEFDDAHRNIDRFGPLSTIYSAGLFDYIKSERLVSLLGGLYDSLQPDGVLIAPFKEQRYYDTFDYHWYSKWHYFKQRSEDEYRSILAKAGVPDDAISLERDESGVILFFVVRR